MTIIKHGGESRAASPGSQSQPAVLKIVRAYQYSSTRTTRKNAIRSANFQDRTERVRLRCAECCGPCAAAEARGARVHGRGPHGDAGMAVGNLEVVEDTCVRPPARPTVRVRCTFAKALGAGQASASGSVASAVQCTDSCTEH